MMVNDRRSGPRYRIDERVFFSTQAMNARSQQSPERYTIVAVMPVDRAGVHQYRLRPSGAGPERVANELELTR